jgi:DNA-binding response OmpR family regulator
MDGYKEKCLKIGMNDYIAKPFNADELKSKLHLHIGKKPFFSRYDTQRPVF